MGCDVTSFTFRRITFSNGQSLAKTKLPVFLSEPFEQPVSFAAASCLVILPFI